MENGKFIFPGSSFRGIFRSHAEKIARSLVTLNSSNASNFLNKCPACNPFADKEDPLTSCNVIFREYKRTHKNEEIKDDKLCLACQLFGSSFKGSRLYVNDGEMIDPPEIKIMDFLAIDRFTGGGKEGAKFDALVLWQPRFKLRIFVENPKDWQLGWLMLVMKDLKEGLVSFGFGKNKWFGKATIEEETIKIGVISEVFIPGGLENGDSYEGIFNTQILQLKELIEKDSKPVELWIKEFHKILSEFRRVNNLVPASDTYFKDDVSELYPKEVGI
jgi:CRISPR-associated RAMP protein (TIGR02581 family)